MRQPITIGGIKISPGQNLTIDLKIPRLYTHGEMILPIHVIHSKKDGPCLFISAAIHGDEIIGVEIIRRLLKLKVLKTLRGTLLAVPVVNVYGFINRSRYLPDRRDLNRFFPGSDKGSLTSQLAALIMEEIVSKCTHGIDLHTGSNHRINLPQIRACLEGPETESLALAFGAPVILDTNVRDGSLRQAVKEKGIPMLLYEAGEALRFDERAIRIGIKGILSVMRALGMLLAKEKESIRFKSLIARSSTWVRAPISGIISTKTRLGEMVSEGSVIGKIADPFGENEVEVSCPLNGIVIGKLELPLTYRGDALFHIASVNDVSSVEEQLNSFFQ